MKYLELSDTVSLMENKLEAATYPIERQGVIRDSNITLDYLDKLGDKILVTCDVDGLVSHLLLTVDNRLPVGLTREQMEEEDWGFLFANTEGKPADWKFVHMVQDHNDDVPLEYTTGQVFFESYTETPVRDLMPRNLDIKLALYYLPQEVKNVAGMAVIEIGPDLENKSGLVTYYSLRGINKTDVNYL